MNEKNNLLRVIGVVFIATVFSGAIAAGLCLIFNSKDQFDNRGVEKYQPRERELLERIGEYQRREEARNRREAERIAAERERIERTEAAIRAIRESDRRSSDLLQELAKEIGILADFFDCVKRDYFDTVNNGDFALDEISEK